jgi:dolichol-phosphate mannosyltransferase
VRSLVVVPTYQEAENVVRFLDAVRAATPETDLLVVDDNSPDGTADLAEARAAEIGRVTVIRRPVKDGLGNAYRRGFRWGLDQGYDVIIQMDCDFSHDPKMIPTFLAKLEAGADCAIGSRYIPGGATPDWPFHRRALSKYGNLYTCAVLQLPIHDSTGGFRAYKASTLEKIDIDGTEANGYAFQSEVARRMVSAGLVIEEVPITFLDRKYGTSKMSVRIMTESMTLVTRWGISQRLARRRAERGAGKE